MAEPLAENKQDVLEALKALEALEVLEALEAAAVIAWAQTPMTDEEHADAVRSGRLWSDISKIPGPPAQDGSQPGSNWKPNEKGK